MTRLTHRDFRAMLDCIGEIYVHHDLESFGQRVFELVPKLLRASYTAYNEINTRLMRSRYFFDTPNVDLGPHEHVWEILRREQPLLLHYQKTGDGSAHRLSDFLSRRRYHESMLYREAFRRANVEYQMAFYLPDRPPNQIAIALVRDRCDFSERERLILNLLRPHFFQAYRNAEATHLLHEEAALATRALNACARGVVTLDARGAVRSCAPRARQWLEQYFGKALQPRQLPGELRRWIRQQQLPATSAHTLPSERQPLVVRGERGRLTVRLLCNGVPGGQMLVLEERVDLSAAPLQSLGLTAREAEVLLWVAQGKTNSEIGQILGASPGTVHKHTEHIFKKLGVETRTAASACAWEMLREGGN